MNAGETRETVTKTVQVGQVKHSTRRTRTTKPNRKTDGQDGPPQAVPPVETQVQIVSRPGAANSALKEAPKPGDGVDPNHPQRARGLFIADALRGIVAGGTRKRIAVCGFASSSRDLAPVHDPAWEIWGLNQLYRHIKRADRWFDIHFNWEQEVVPGTEGGFDTPDSYKHWMANCGMPVYMHHLVPEIPTAVQFPVERLIARYGADYFTSTIAFMVALAIEEIEDRVNDQFATWVRRTPKKQLEQTSLVAVRKAMFAEYAIGIYGVDLIVGDEYFWQKACAEFWIGAASTLGINVALPPTTALCKQMYRYGYEKEPESIVKLSEIAAHEAELGKQREEHLKAVYCLDGALQTDAYWKELVTLRLRGMANALSPLPPKG